MSNNETPIIELPCQQITTSGQILDTSGNGLDGNVVGAQIVPNDTLGAVVYLDGIDDSISVAQNNVLNPEGDFTVEIWVAVSDPQTTTSDIVIAEKWDGFATSYPYSLRYNSNGSVYASRYDGTRRPSITSQTLINDGQLHQLALVLQAGRLFLYIDGALDPAAPDGVADTTVASTANTAPLYLGSRSGGCYLSGALGPFRLYGGALDADQINLDMTGDCTSTRAFTRTQPIDFGLYNENDLSLIVIDDNADGHGLTLQVENIDGQDLVLNPLAGWPTPSDYHFSLTFRPGVLSQNSIATAALASSGWLMTGPVQLPDGSYTFYFIAPTNTILSSANPLLIGLTNISANPAGGSREGMAKLDYANLNYVGDSTPVNGSRSQRIALANSFQPATASGTPAFLVSFPQSNHLLNDARPHSFDVRLTNISGQTLTFNPIGSDTPTSLVFSMDVGDSEGDLGTTDDLYSFTVNPKAYSWVTQVTDEGESVECVLQPTNASFSLSPGGSLFFTLENLGSSLPSGDAYLYVDFSNVSGIADGQVIGIIVKTPLVYLSDTSHSVGIGTATPDNNSKLQVAGTLTASNILSQGNVQMSQAIITQSLHAPQATIDNNLQAGSFSGGMGIVQPGMVMMWAGNSNNLPNGWRLCNGDYLYIANYPDLYTAIGTSYGSGSISGNPVFYLPNLKDRFVVGAGNLYSLNARGGAASVTLTTNQIPSHSHSSSVSSDNQHRHSFLVDTGGDGNDGAGDMLTSNWGNNVDANHQEYTDYQSAHTHTVTIGNTGGGQSHENLPPYCGLFFIIYTGVGTN